MDGQPVPPVPSHVGAAGQQIVMSVDQEQLGSRHEAGIANRTITWTSVVLSGVLKSCGRWRALADHVHIIRSDSVQSATP